MHWTDKYDLTVGLEIHLQLDLQSKAFASESNAISDRANTLISDVSLALPGSLPVLNEQQMIYAATLAIALNSEIQPKFFFDRKHYFYADLPKGYQITQDTAHYCRGGSIPFYLDEQLQYVQLHHIHMEEDAGKSIHDQNPTFTLLDYNRAGTPLLEIVTQPDLHSVEAVSACLDSMQQIAQYLNISTADMEKGMMRADCNVSLSLKGSDTLGTRCEIKNLNSKRFARKAILVEAERQAKILDKGGSIQQQTMNYNPKSNRNVPIRDKETLHDYRYFPDPDLPEFCISQKTIDRIKSEQPSLPFEHVAHLMDTYQISHDDAIIVTKTKDEALLVKELLTWHPAHKTLFNFYLHGLRPVIQYEQDGPAYLRSIKSQIIEVVQLIQDKKIAASSAIQDLLPLVLRRKETSALTLASELNLIISGDTDEMADLISEIIQAHGDKVKAYQSGKKGLIGFFMGEYMRKSSTKPDPALLKKAFTLVLN